MPLAQTEAARAHLCQHAKNEKPKATADAGRAGGAPRQHDDAVVLCKGGGWQREGQCPKEAVYACMARQLKSLHASRPFARAQGDTAGQAPTRMRATVQHGNYVKCVPPSLSH